MLNRLVILAIVSASSLTTAFNSVSRPGRTAPVRPFAEATEHLYSIDNNGRLFVNGAVNAIEKQGGGLARNKGMNIANGATAIMSSNGASAKINGAPATSATASNSVISVNGAVNSSNGSSNGSNPESNGKAKPKPMVMAQGKDEAPRDTTEDGDDEKEEAETLDQIQRAHETQLGVLQKRIDYFQNSLKAWQQEAHGNTTNAKDVISDLQDQLKETEAQLKEERAKSAELASQVTSLSTELSELQNIFNTQVKELVEQYEREHALRRTEQENAKMRLEQALMDSESKMQQVLDRNIQAVHNAKQRAAEQVEEQAAEMEELRQDLALARTTIQDATVYLMELKEERTSIRSLVKLTWSLVKERVGLRVRRGQSTASAKSFPRRDT